MTYFGNYRRVVLLSQQTGPELVAQALDAAIRLGLPFVHHPTGRDGLRAPVLSSRRQSAAHLCRGAVTSSSSSRGAIFPPV